MKKLIITTAMLSFVILTAQEQPKKDSLSTKKIESVTITKKVVQHKSDRLIFDVSATPSTKGNSAFEVLKQTPTVSTTDDKDFKILGKNSVVFYINGRPSNMNSDAILQLLKSTPAENISKIEVISTPGSEYDVPSGMGIVNILMKKKTTDGYNGTLKMENTQRVYNNSNSNASFNFRKNKLAGNFNIGYSDFTNKQDMALESGTSNIGTKSVGESITPQKNLSLNASLDYDLTDKSYLNWTLNSYFSDSNNDITKFYNETFVNSLLQKSTLMENRSTKNAKNFSTGLNYDLKLDDKGSKLMLKAAYMHYENQQHQQNRNYQASSMALLYGFNQSMPQIIDNVSFKTDWIKKFKDESTLSIGGNYNFTKTDNNTYFEKGDGIRFVKDDEQSNYFTYQENVGALYVNYERMLGEKISSKVGLRYELTHTKGDVLGKVGDFYHFKNQYGNLRPFLNLAYNISDQHNLSYNFSSRVGRPSFWEINPVRTYVTNTNYVQNNPFLLPIKSYNQELTYMYRQAYFLSLGYDYYDDMNTQIPLQRDNTIRYIRTNYGSKQQMTATLGMQKTFFKNRWIANYIFTMSHDIFKGQVDTDPITQEKFTPYVLDRTTTYFVISTNNQVGLDKNKTLWLGMNYVYVSFQNMELGKLKPIQGLDISLKKNWKEWTFKASVDDVFNSMGKFTVRNFQNGYFNNVWQNSNMRSYALSITYNFGNQKLKFIRKSENANEEIRSRTGK